MNICESCGVKRTLCDLLAPYPWSRSVSWCLAEGTDLPGNHLYIAVAGFLQAFLRPTSGCSGLVEEYRTRNREIAGSTHTRSTASNLEQVVNLLCAQANSASYPQRTGNE